MPSSQVQALSAVRTRSFWSRSRSAVNSRASPTVTEPVPRTTTAFRFLLPMTAPAPPRPALWYWSVERQAKGTSCSPAGPVERTLCHGPISSRIFCSRAAVSRPQKRPSASQELDPVVLDEHQHRVRRPAGDDDQVVPGELELRRERAAHVGVQERARRGALAADREARAGRHGGTGERAGRQDERIAGRERVGARDELLEEIPEKEALAAYVQAGPLVGQRLDGRRQSGQVEAQHAPGVEVHGPPQAGGSGP